MRLCIRRLSHKNGCELATSRGLRATARLVCCMSNAIHSIRQSIKSPECPCVHLFLSYLPSVFSFLFLHHSLPFFLSLPHSLSLPLPFPFTFPSPFTCPSSFPFPSSIFLSVSTSVRLTFEAPYLHNGAR